MAAETYHEAIELLSIDTRDMHRAIVSLMEELEAIDWYQQRADAASDPALKSLLLHNKNEEIEHAAMLMEWIRRHDGHFATMMRKFLFRDAPILALEEGAKTGDTAEPTIATLGIGTMKGK